MLIDYQERGQTDLGDKLFNFKKLVSLLFDFREGFGSMEEFCREGRAGRLKQVEEALFLLKSVLESFEDIRMILDRGVDLSNNSHHRINQVLARGRLELRRSAQGPFEFRVAVGETDALDPHEFDDLFSFAKIKINQRLDRPVQCFRDFFDVFSRARGLVKRLDAMLAQGLAPHESLLRPFKLADQRQELARRVDAAERQVGEWEQFTQRLFEDCDEVETFFLALFQGPNLSTLSRTNLVHYLRFFSRDMRLEWAGLDGQSEHLGDSRAKIEYLKRLLAENRQVIRQNVLARKNKVLLSPNRLNYLRVPENKTHQFLLHLYADRFEERLECSKLLFSSEDTRWETIRSSPNPRLHPPQRARPQRKHLLCPQRLAPAALAGQAHVSGVLGAAGAGQALQRGLLPGPPLRRQPA